MFKFFANKNSDKPPIPEEARIWMENAFIWLIKQFGEEKITSTQSLLPVEADKSTLLDNTDKIAYNLLKVICDQMDLNPDNIIITFFSHPLIKIRGEAGPTIISQQYENDNYSTGLYQGMQPDGKYYIGIEKSQLNEPNLLIATLAHEIAHIKLLGENRLTENDEYLTDLVTVFFGIGIFNSNAAFNFYSNADEWGYKKQGYLSQQEWGYALALYAYVRRERSPAWMKYLTANILSDFKKSEAYIYANMDKVLV